MLNQSAETKTCKAAVPGPLAHAACEPGVPGSLLQRFKLLWLHVVRPITVYLDTFGNLFHIVEKNNNAFCVTM